MNNFTKAPINFEEFKIILNKLRNDEIHVFQSDSYNEATQIERSIKNLMEENPELTKKYNEYLSAKAELNKKAAEAKKAETNAKTKQYIERKKRQEEKNSKNLNGTIPTPQSSREGFSNSAPGNKVPSYISPFAKRNKMGQYIDPNTGKPYPGQ